MISLFRKSDDFSSYLEKGDGAPMILLHGLMGGLSNFEQTVAYFSTKYRVIVPQLPLYDLPLLNTTVKSLTQWLYSFVEHHNITDRVILVGNSLGGHISLLFTKLYPEMVKAMVLTGSSGLYEKAMGDSYPKRGSYEYIEKKCQEVFYDPNMATKEIVDDVFSIVRDRNKILRTLSIAKSAIRHNMSSDVKNMDLPVCLIWGANDGVTPPEVAREFNTFFPQSELFFIEKCGHAPMMEHPDQFNHILDKWLIKKEL